MIISFGLFLATQPDLKRLHSCSFSASNFSINRKGREGSMLSTVAPSSRLSSSP
uniref:Uncharacterized protein n=1 Tax=Arundo donax TaxID=35708 RepID=A0A0A9FDP8_ARUDO